MQSMHSLPLDNQAVPSPVMQQQHQMMSQQQQQQMLQNQQIQQMNLAQQQQQMGTYAQVQSTPAGGMTSQQQSYQQISNMSNVQAQQNVDVNPFHPANRVKQLLPELKFSLASLLKVAADVVKFETNALTENATENDAITVNQSSASDSVQRNNVQQAFDNFSSICDQMEQCFVLLQESERQLSWSNVYLPVNVSLGTGSDRSDETSGQTNRMTLTYPQFSMTVGKQLDYAKRVHDRLSEFVDELSK